MFFYLFLLFIVLPLVEIMILVQIGLVTEWWVPLAIVVLTGIIGSALARWQGWKVLERVREEMTAGRVPGDALIDAFLVLLAGILFVMPGVLSDLVGIALLIPPVRSLVKRGARAWIAKKVEVRVGRIHSGFRPGSDSASRVGRDQIIDAKVLGTRVEDASKTRS